MPYSSPTIEIPHSELSNYAVHDSLGDTARGLASLDNAFVSTAVEPTPLPIPPTRHPHEQSHSQRKLVPQSWEHHEKTKRTHASMGTNTHGSADKNAEHESPPSPSASIPRTLSPPPRSPTAANFLPPGSPGFIPNNSSLSESQKAHAQQPMGHTPSLPLKSSLKPCCTGNVCGPAPLPSSSTSRRIPSPTRSASAPATTPFMKCVHFATKDAVLLFHKSRRPSSLFSQTMEDYSSAAESASEAEASCLRFGDVDVALPFPATPTISRKSLHARGHGRIMTAHAIGKDNTAHHGKKFDITLSTTKSSSIPREPGHIQVPVQGNSDCNVHLESVCLRQQPPRRSLCLPADAGVGLEGDSTILHGTILIKNICFEKIVRVRFSLDEWQTTNEVSATWESSVSESEGRWDRFGFDVDLSTIRNLLARRFIMAIRYSALCQEGGGEYWDNNSGLNYCFAFESAPLLLHHATEASASPPAAANVTAIADRAGKSIAGAQDVLLDSISQRLQSDPHPSFPSIPSTQKSTLMFPHANGADVHSDSTDHYRTLHLPNLSNCVSPSPHPHPSPQPYPHPDLRSKNNSTPSSNSESPALPLNHSAPSQKIQQQNGTSAAVSSPSGRGWSNPTSIPSHTHTHSTALLALGAPTTRPRHPRFAKYNAIAGSCRPYSTSSTIVPTYTK